MSQITLEEKLEEKSIEAFTMALEIYNKPTIKYRVEGFTIFICNAWELMLKAHMIKKYGSDSIYYKNNKDRTISLENCISKVFTNNKDPLRKNLEKILELRNISTHFITEEYEMIYVPLFQSCILNFNEKILKFHGVDMTEYIPQNFLTLSPSMKNLNEDMIRAKYPDILADRLIKMNTNIKSQCDVNGENFAINIRHHHYITKDIDKATSIVHIDNTAKESITVIKEIKDINQTHPNTTKICVDKINKLILKNNLKCELHSKNDKFNTYHFGLFTKYYKLKENQKMCYHMNIGNRYLYTNEIIDFIYNEIKKDPENIIQNLRNKQKKISPP